MVEGLLILIVLLLVASLVLAYRAQSKSSSIDFQPVLSSFDTLERGITKLESALRNEVARNREETNRNSKETREELTNSFHALGDSVSTRMSQIADVQTSQLETFANNLSSLTRTNEDKLTHL